MAFQQYMTKRYLSLNHNNVIHINIETRRESKGIHDYITDKIVTTGSIICKLNASSNHPEEHTQNMTKTYLSILLYHIF